MIIDVDGHIESVLARRAADLIAKGLIKIIRLSTVRDGLELALRYVQQRQADLIVIDLGIESQGRDAPRPHAIATGIKRFAEAVKESDATAVVSHVRPSGWLLARERRAARAATRIADLHMTVESDVVEADVVIPGQARIEVRPGGTLPPTTVPLDVDSDLAISRVDDVLDAGLAERLIQHEAGRYRLDEADLGSSLEEAKASLELTRRRPPSRDFTVGEPVADTTQLPQKPAPTWASPLRWAH
jgi:hypothetical protein